MSFEENLKIREDLLAGKIPKRVFMRLVFTLEAACGFSGIDLRRAHYDPELKNKAMHSICEAFYSDTFPIENVRFPAVYQTLGAKNWRMSSTGAMQHPEVESFTAEDYDDFIENPYGVINERILPRICKALNTSPEERSINLTKAYVHFLQTVQQEGAFMKEATEEFGYVPNFFMGTIVEAPFDFLSDQLRGFKGVNVDVRRIPDKVEKAVNAILPLMIKQAIPRNVPEGHIGFIPLHLAPYLRPKDFERLYWSTLEKLVVEMHKRGEKAFLFAEVDWTRYAEYLARLPENTIIQFENGDVKHIKEVVGKKQIIGGFFDPTITLTRSKEQCLDEAKRLIDIGAPSGKFFFAFDRHVMDINSVDVNKLQAVINWVHENTDY